MYILCIPSQASAWGKEGHAIVAEIAMHYVSDPTRAKVLEILKNISVPDAGNWMDNMRSNDYYKFMQHWHYVDIPKDSSYKSGQGDNLIAALNTSFNELKKNNINAEKTQEDLLILFHLIGDMHQPLHTGYPDDKGGNDIQVSFKGSGTNLHHLWDSDLIEDQNITTDTVLSLADQLPKAMINAIRNGNFLSWMNDSRSLLPQVYNFNGHKIDQDYEDRNKRMLELQLLKGGIRLAKVLDAIFASTSATDAPLQGQ